MVTVIVKLERILEIALQIARPAVTTPVIMVKAIAIVPLIVALAEMGSVITERILRPA